MILAASSIHENADIAVKVNCIKLRQVLAACCIGPCSILHAMQIQHCRHLQFDLLE